MHQSGIPVDFNWIEYLNLAKEIAADMTLGATQESKLRCAISRAYYAAFHKAKSVAFPEGAPNSPGIHTLVTLELKSHNDPRYRQLGIDLDRLKDNRTKADYHVYDKGEFD